MPFTSEELTIIGLPAAACFGALIAALTVDPARRQPLWITTAAFAVLTAAGAIWAGSVDIEPLLQIAPAAVSVAAMVVTVLLVGLQIRARAPVMPPAPSEPHPDQRESIRASKLIVRKAFLEDRVEVLTRLADFVEQGTERTMESLRLWRPREPADHYPMPGPGNFNPEGDHIVSLLQELIPNEQVRLDDAPLHQQNPGRPIPGRDECDPGVVALYSFVDGRRHELRRRFAVARRPVEDELRGVRRHLIQVGAAWGERWYE